MSNLVERGSRKVAVAVALAELGWVVPNKFIGLGALGVSSVIGNVGTLQVIVGLGEGLDEDPPTGHPVPPEEPQPARQASRRLILAPEL